MHERGLPEEYDADIIRQIASIESKSEHPIAKAITNYAKQKNITFIQNLGRKGRGLQSGDDTTFIKQYSSMNIEALFDPDIVVYHYINKDRYKLKYMIRRAYWQGVSEVRRHSFVFGLKKEFDRAKKIDFKQNQLFILPKIILSCMFIVVFLTGALCQRIILGIKPH